jgi:hypothetical protein
MLGASIPSVNASSNPFGGGDLKSTFSALSAQSKPGIYAGIGSTIGGALAPNTSSPLPPGFNNPLPPVNPTLAHGAGHPTTPQFTNYNPYAAVTGGGYSFFPGGS